MNEKSHLEKKFERYHAENPNVYDLFVRYVKEVIAAGHKRYSANAIFERIRWHVMVETRGDKFKLNNNYRAFYARMFMERNPQFEGFFETRKQKSKEKGEH